MFCSGAQSQPESERTIKNNNVDPHQPPSGSGSREYKIDKNFLNFLIPGTYYCNLRKKSHIFCRFFATADFSFIFKLTSVYQKKDQYTKSDHQYDTVKYFSGAGFESGISQC